MTPLLACDRALGMRQRHLRQKRLRAIAGIVHQIARVCGWLFILLIVFGVV